MRLWLLIIAVALTQELATSNAVFLEAYQAGYPLAVIHVIYVVCTVVDIVLFYLLGLWVRRMFPENRAIAWVERFGHRLEARAGKVGLRAAIFLVGVLNFTQVDAFALAWLSYGFLEVGTILFVSNMVAYAMQWAFLFGVQALIPSRAVVIGVIIVGPLAFALAARILKGQFERV